MEMQQFKPTMQKPLCIKDHEDRKKIEEIALKKIEEMKIYIEKAKTLVSILEEKGLVDETHTKRPTCNCRSCLVFKYSHKLKK